MESFEYKHLFHMHLFFQSVNTYFYGEKERKKQSKGQQREAPNTVCMVKCTSKHTGYTYAYITLAEGMSHILIYT